MLLTILLPFVASFSLYGTPQSSTYNYVTSIEYSTIVTQPTVYTNNEVYYSYTYVTFNLQLYFDDANSFRLDYNSVDINWNVVPFDVSSNYILSDSRTITIPEEYAYYNYDSINNFKPYLVFGTSNILTYGMYSLALWNVDVNNTPHNIYTTGIASTSTFDSPQSCRVDFDMTQFRNYLNEYMSSVGHLSSDYNNGYSAGYYNGYNEGYGVGNGEGYSQGYLEGSDVDQTAITIFNGILNIALVPINFFLAIFNFEILGINISQFVSALLSICLVIIVVRFVTGKKQGGD